MLFHSYLYLDYFFFQVKYRKINFKTRGLVFYPFSSYIMNLLKSPLESFCTSNNVLELNLILEFRNL
ncbi:hypothetical protein OIU77_004231 [Salix suchowensis]|uniref:Uncharacterized protein n=1 Tax=Salix suchowensis TaxID=1278906 RepID=A0ABQ9ATP3_9ROSI|nr:hypothetical protein OIU77_004231 [Salix suchowensis]